LLDAVNVLINGVGRAFVPVFVNALLGRQDFDVFVELAAEEAPAGRDVAIEAASLVLGQYQDTAQTAVDAVGEGEVDDAVQPAEGDGRLGAVAGERLQAGAFAAREDQRQDLFHLRAS